MPCPGGWGAAAAVVLQLRSVDAGLAPAAGCACRWPPPLIEQVLAEAGIPVSRLALQAVLALLLVVGIGSRGPAAGAGGGRWRRPGVIGLLELYGPAGGPAGGLARGGGAHPWLPCCWPCRRP
jgi:hypothetical protein